MSGRVVHNQYRHCIKGSSLEWPITVYASTWNVTSLHLWFGIMSLWDTVNFLNKIKRLFRKYNVSKVNEAFLFDVSIDEKPMIRNQQIEFHMILPETPNGKGIPIMIRNINMIKKRNLTFMKVFYQPLIAIHEVCRKSNQFEPRHDKMCLREFPTRLDTNRPAQPQKLARVLKFRL